MNVRKSTNFLEEFDREKVKNGDRVRAYVLEVRRENKGPQIFLSRTCPEFMAKLFTQEVPEIYDGIVQIMGDRKVCRGGTIGNIGERD